MYPDPAAKAHASMGAGLGRIELQPRPAANISSTLSSVRSMMRLKRDGRGLLLYPLLWDTEILEATW